MEPSRTRLREGADVVTGSSHKTFPVRRGGSCPATATTRATATETQHRRLPGTNSSYHLHHALAGKAVALAEFEALASTTPTTPSPTRRPYYALAAEGFDVSGRGLWLHGRPSGSDTAWHVRFWSWSGRCSLVGNRRDRHEYEHVLGDTKAMLPSGLRLGTQELTRHGMGPSEMEEVAALLPAVADRR